MDKKNLTIGITLLIAAFAMLYFAPRSAPPSQPSNVQPAAAASQAPAADKAGAPSSASTQPATPLPTPSSEFAAVNQEAAAAKTTTLGNDYIEARFTNYGGALRDVAFKKHAAVQGKPEPYILNLVHEDPLLAITEYPGLGTKTVYELVSATATQVEYRTVIFEGKVEVTRRYRLLGASEAGADPYRVHHETTFRNLGTTTVPVGRLGLSVGTAALLSANDTPHYLNIVTFDGEDPHYIERGELEGAGFTALFGASRAPKPLLERQGPTVWAAAKNQFFTSLYTPEKPGTGVVVKRIELPPFPSSQIQNIGITGALRSEVGNLGPNETAKLAGLLYVGPQEYPRLSKFDHKEDRVLPYTQLFFNRMFLSGYVAPLLNTLMNAMHKWVGNWGVAIILMTLLLKIVTLPFTLAASKSAKRMAKLQPLMQEIREKYKDNPQKQQMATMELFKTHRVNPVGGCIPILITFPLFIGFFAMLQCTAELRFQPFLWAKDLATYDTVATIFGFPINIMPILMGATMVFQMRLTPTPSVDNMQVKIMKFMPIIFTAFCYFFSCALALYSTINGIFTIGQQLVINRMKDDPAPVSPGTTAATTASAFSKKRPMKNVTPKDKKLK